MGIIKRYILMSVSLLLFLIVRGQETRDLMMPGHEYVDLGLSVNWATCNIGAYKPEEYGDYFAWGETYTKSCYNKMTYKFSGETHALNDFNTVNDQFKSLVDYTKYLGEENKLVPNDIKLDLIDDVAHAQWGNHWRMPTKDEIDELVNSCDWVFDIINSIKGYWAVSRINGNRIFFPLAGYIYDDIVSDVGKSGKYWASELRFDMCFEAYQIWISHEDDIAIMYKKTSVFLSDDGFRENGRSVRAVFDRKNN